MKALTSAVGARPHDADAGAFPATRYQGSKAKLAGWIWEQIGELQFSTCLDAFGGTGAISFLLKRHGKCVTYNDLLRFNHLIGRALIENAGRRLSPSETDWLLGRHEGIEYPNFVQDTFAGIYFTDEENAWIDRTIANIGQMSDGHKSAMAFFALAQACIVKRPYNLFHRRNLYMRTADVPRTFGNKAAWDRPFEDWFRRFVGQANGAVFDNGRANHSLNLDAADVPGEFDLVYIDPPYISARGTAADYAGFYHFLEGLADYERWPDRIDWRSRHRRMLREPSEWTDPAAIAGAFDRIFRRYRRSLVVVSYRGDGIPTEEELVALLRQYKDRVRVCRHGRYKYALSTSRESNELLLIGQ